MRKFAQRLCGARHKAFVLYVTRALCRASKGRCARRHNDLVKKSNSRRRNQRGNKRTVGFGDAVLFYNFVRLKKDSEIKEEYDY